SGPRLPASASRRGSTRGTPSHHPTRASGAVLRYVVAAGNRTRTPCGHEALRSELGCCSRPLAQPWSPSMESLDGVPRWSPCPVGGGTALRRSAAGLDALIL